MIGAHQVAAGHGGVLLQPRERRLGSRAVTPGADGADALDLAPLERRIRGVERRRHLAVLHRTG